MINDKTITCNDCVNFILCGIKQKDTNVFKCSAYLNIKEIKQYFNKLLKNKQPINIKQE